MTDPYPHRYGAFGLTLRSNRVVDGLLPPCAATPEIIVDFVGEGVPASADQPPVAVTENVETLWYLGEDRWLLRYDHPVAAGVACSITIEPARMTVCWTHGIPFTDILTALLGPGFGALLHLRGIPPLHACAIDLGGRAIVIMGQPGAGKSTTAAAFVRAGYAVLADDTAALEIARSTVLVAPGVTRVRVFADSANALGWTAEELPRVFSTDDNPEKRYIDGRATAGSLGAVPVARMYLLKTRDPASIAPDIEPIPARLAPAVLFHNAYAMRYADRARHGKLFQDLARVAALVPLRHVRASDSLAALPRLVAALVEDATERAPT
jgi:hypothetical protein